MLQGNEDVDLRSKVVAGRPLDEASVRSLTILNLSGDSTLVWGPDNDEVMKEVVARKIKEGFAFFVMEKRWSGLLPDRKVAVTDVDKAMASRRLTMADELFASIVTGGAIQLVRTPGKDPSAPQPRLVRDPALIASSQCVSVRHPVGG